jgi:predicted esterase
VARPGERAWRRALALGGAAGGALGAASISVLGADPARVYLVAYSNGGRGATRALAAEPGAYAGVAFVSATAEHELVTSASFRRAVAPGLPALVVHGEEDERIPFAYAQASARLLRRAGADVTVASFPGRDHYVLFDDLDGVLAALERWLPAGACDRPGPGSGAGRGADAPADPP